MAKKTKPIKLKDFVNDDIFIEKINNAFMDLRADYELSMDVNKAKIEELRRIHIDNKNYLSDLQSYSKKSSGVLSGLRGTGKTHLFLLARNNIISTIDKDKALCIYLNLKRFSIPQNVSQELINRAFSIFMYNQISYQLVNILESMGENTLWEKFKVIFDNDKKKFNNGISSALFELSKFKAIAHQGDEEFADLDKGNITKDDFNKEVLNFSKGIGYKATIKILEFAFEELGLESIDLEVFPFNERGIALYKKLGFKIEDNIVDEEAEEPYRNIITMLLMKANFNK
ncbi:GNAT family N-acetyltransferase [Maledivibacter halophilus]|uniref:Acetyltransferases, including N-acetylases of ribosomal proteins n=1 Tax=Maledivibacter halophilus TaxID=36842 RepID=A0A1T5LN14_9FIRM|nr:GNAT family protein [Maledivibacter halophilus]SKC77362.1 Acetyltransferases, including N-acetylases of ribosomal proteins [Maledivibacter halophilus]